MQVFQKLEDLRLHGDVERGRRLIGDQKIGTIGERHRDHHPLALSAGELVRIGLKPLRRIDNADFGQKFDDPFLRNGRAAMMKRDDLADLPLDRMQRIERRHRLLKHHGDGVAAHRAQFVDGHLEHVAAAKEDLAAWIAGRGLRQEAHDRLRGDGLARAGFADQRQRATFFKPKGNAIDDCAPLAALSESDRELAHVEKRLGLAHKNVFLGSKASRTASPIKMRSESMSAVTAKAESPIQGADKIRLALQQKFAERRRPRRHAQP